MWTFKNLAISWLAVAAIWFIFAGITPFYVPERVTLFMTSWTGLLLMLLPIVWVVGRVAKSLRAQQAQEFSLRAKQAAFAEGYSKGRQHAEPQPASERPQPSSEPERSINEPPPVQQKYRTERFREAATAEQTVQQPKPEKNPKPASSGKYGPLPSDRW